MGYKVPDDYDYLTGGTLKKDKDGKLLPDQLTRQELERRLFPVPTPPRKKDVDHG